MAMTKKKATTTKTRLNKAVTNARAFIDATSIEPERPTAAQLAADAAATAKRNASALTEDETKEVQRGIYATWNVIGLDLFSGDANDTMSRAEVIEVTLDADYIEMYGRVEKQALKKFRSLDYDGQIAIARGVFKFARYGY